MTTTLKLTEAARLLGGTLSGPDAVFGAVTTDSRKLHPGELFVALQGARFDGHEFLGMARDHGVCAALVSYPVAVELPQIQVADTRLALGQLGAYWRSQFQGRLVALTGSNGKTTVKEMTAAILRQADAAVLATLGNLNNDIGVPLTLLRLQPDHAYAVIEMGANHAGEIAYLTALARPDVAIITNAGPAHLEGFGSLDGVSRAKGEIYQGLIDGGVAVINADDVYADYWRGLNRQRRVIDFGIEQPAAVCGELLDNTGLFRLMIDNAAVNVQLPLPGRHNVLNALAAAAAAHALGLDLELIRCGLESVSGVAGRLQRVPGPAGSSLIDDTYNANPASLAAGLALLAAEAGERWLVLGDMAELGADADHLHEQAGQAARAAGITRLFALGRHSRCAVLAFGPGAEHFTTVEALTTALRAALPAAGPVTLLVKGSRSMGMERVVHALAPVPTTGVAH